LDGGPVIHGINLRIRRGEKVAIVGRSGSGKSTLLLAIQGVLSAIEGEITVDGIPLENLSDDCVRSMMAYSAQNLPFIEQIVGDAMDLRGESGFVARRILETAAIDLESTIGISATGYSSGEEQRMSLARAIARDAGFVFLDEPTSFLDPSNEAIIFEILRGLKAAVICATHSLRQADLFDRVIVMADGRIVEEGVPADLRCSEGAYSALLGDERNVQVEGLMGNA
jgi:ABC-type multidrug transport system fused ATPase/permease subunit